MFCIVFLSTFLEVMSVTWLVNLTYRINSKKCCNAFQAFNGVLIRKLDATKNCLNYGIIIFRFNRINVSMRSLISSFLEIDFEINISDKKSRRFDLSEVIFNL